MSALSQWKLEAEIHFKQRVALAIENDRLRDVNAALVAAVAEYVILGKGKCVIGKATVEKAVAALKLAEASRKTPAPTADDDGDDDLGADDWMLDPDMGAQG